MSMLNILDYHYGENKGESSEVEYRLVSWGEIYPPFLGNREHSIQAQFILHDFPFKLFSISTPYSEVPQKLNLTFHAPHQFLERGKTISSGIYPHNAAKEFAAFMSLLTRRRIFAINQTRYDGLPLERSVDIYGRSHLQKRQRLKEIDPKEIARLLKNLYKLDDQIAHQYMLSTQLYHTAVEMIYAEPEFAYLFLVMSIEAISNAVYKGNNTIDVVKEKAELNHYLNSTYPDWDTHFDITEKEKKTKVVEMLLSKAYFSRRKFRNFISENLPEKFWTESEDDAKPEHIYSIIKPGDDGRGKEEIRRSEMTINQWEKIQKDNLSKILNNIYDTRSKLVHEGIRFPAHIVIGHYEQIPINAQNQMMASLLKAGQSDEFFLDVPPLLTFERLVSYTMIEYLRKQDNP